MTETDHFTILIADRNPHVRKFLRRELAADGFRVLMAKDGREVLKLLHVNERPDLLILDLEIPHVTGLDILRQLQEREHLLPVVVHTLLTDHANYPEVQKAAAFVEKTGDNIDNLRAVILGVLQNWYPERQWEQNVKELKSTVFDPKSGHSVPYGHRR